LGGVDRTKAAQKLDTLLIGPTDPEAVIAAEVLRRRPDPAAYIDDILNGGAVLGLVFVIALVRFFSKRHPR